MKKFIVTGTPRSGTTFLCNKFASLKNVYMDPEQGYEPFSIGSPVLDEKEYVKNLVETHSDKIVGLKAFWGDTYMMTHFLETMDPIIILRKDIQRVFLSFLVFAKVGHDQNKSSKNIPGVSDAVYYDFGLEWNAQQLLKYYYYSEKVQGLYHIYFEDMIGEKKSHPILEDYFESELDLNTSYQDTRLEDYHPDPSRFIDILRKTALKMDHKKFPDYIRENLHI